MRYNEFNISDPIDELSDRLVRLGRGPMDFNVIKHLIDRISVKHDMPTEKLHHMFVKKYGHSPESWVRKIKQRNETVNETDDGQDIEQINQFIAWAKKVLHVQGDPQFTFSKDTEKAQAGHHTGVHSGDQIWVYIGNRNLIDIFRTVFHELVHQRQDELGMIKNGDSYPGSPIEAMADMLAGKYIKIYGKEHPEIFQ
jgi:hypothetical protein